MCASARSRPATVRASSRSTARLSAESIRNRFFAVHPQLSAAEVAHFTHVDGRDRLAFVATEGSAIVGVGRLERLPASTDAEVAFVVADDHQRQGLGTRLLERLERAARPLGVTHFVADTLFSNTAMLHVLRRPNGSCEQYEDGVVHVRFPIAEVPSAPGVGTFASCAPSRQIRTFDIDLNAQELTMTTITRDPVVTTTDAGSTPIEPTVALKRRTIDTVFVGVGVVLVMVLVVAGGLLTWGANFSKDYVNDELSSQNIAFPPAAALEEEGRTDLLPFAGHAVNTGPEAEAYASFINGHLEGIADGATFADLGDPERAANTAVETATADGASAAQIAELQGEADAITGQRNSLFKGETLRGLLLSAFAWSTVGRIAGFAALAAFAAAGMMLVLVALGLRHHHKVVVQTR